MDSLVPFHPTRVFTPFLNFTQFLSGNAKVGFYSAIRARTRILYPESRPQPLFSVANLSFQVIYRQHQTIPVAGPGLGSCLGLRPSHIVVRTFFLRFSYLVSNTALLVFFHELFNQLFNSDTYLFFFSARSKWVSAPAPLPFLFSFSLFPPLSSPPLFSLALIPSFLHPPPFFLRFPLSPLLAPPIFSFSLFPSLPSPLYPFPFQLNPFPPFFFPSLPSSHLLLAI